MQLLFKSTTSSTARIFESCKGRKKIPNYRRIRSGRGSTLNSTKLAHPRNSRLTWQYPRMPVLSTSKNLSRAWCLLGCVLVAGLFAPAQDAAKPSAPSPLSPPSAQNFPKLVDITSKTGITFDHYSTPELKYVVESMAGGVALIDYDRDGWPDIYFTNAPTVAMALAGQKARSALYHNNHDGTFTDVTDKAGVGYPCWAQGVAVGDYNNDGWPDMLVTCFGGVVLYRNNGNGTFSDVTKDVGLGTENGWATGAAFGDYDHDGWPDLFIDHYVDFRLDNMPRFGSAPNCRYMGIEVQCGPRGLKGAPDNLYHNVHGHFVDVSKQAGVADEQGGYGLTPLWSDFDGDGKLDLLVANDAGVNYLYLGDGAGKFTESGISSGIAYNQDGNNQANMGVALGDYMHTGRQSVLITHFDNEYATLYRNEGKIGFTDVSAFAGVLGATHGYVQWGDAFVDFANSGWPDIFIVSGHVMPQVDTIPQGPKYHEPKTLLLNQRDGKFEDISKEAGPAIQIPQVSRGLAIGDLFNDGKLEAVVENLVSKPMILRPEGGDHGHWVSLQFEGVHADRLALNTRVRVVAGDLAQVQEVLSGGSYISQNDLRLHFGLGKHDRVDRVEITWPNGSVQVLTNLAADRFYTVREGAGVVSSTRPASIAPFRH